MARPSDEGELGPLTLGDRLVVVANPATRRDIREAINSLERAAPEGVVIESYLTSRAGQARELALEHGPGARMLIAAGGDGTVADVAVAAIDHQIPLAILPSGSTNIIAKELRLPSEIDVGAALVVGKHRLKLMDVGISDRHHFLHMAGAGFDSRIFARADPSLKRRFGWLAYLPAAAQSIGDRPSEVSVVVDGERVSTVSPLVLVANGRSLMHAAFKLAPGISKSDGLLDVFIVQATSIPAKVGVVGRFATGHLDQSPNVVRLRGRHVEIFADPPLPVQFDGDVAGETPVQLEVKPGALQVVVPAVPASAGSPRSS